MTDATSKTDKKESYEVLRARSMKSVNLSVVGLVIGIVFLALAIGNFDHLGMGTLPIPVKLIGILVYVATFCGSLGFFVQKVLGHIELIITKSGQDAK